MRITNTMMTNSTLININRNQRYLDKIVRQIESTKKINVPSDDPIVASRALKFRNSVAETEQFKRNVQSGLSWMEISESPLTDINQNLLVQLKELFTEAATGTETQSDKMKLIASIKEIVDQVGLDMNQSYAGRYAFSGYRTDQPPVLIEDNALMSYAIEQSFNQEDVEKIMSYQKIDANGDGKNDEIATKYEDVTVLKLAYKPTGGEDAGGTALNDGEEVFVFYNGAYVKADVVHFDNPNAYYDPGIALDTNGVPIPDDPATTNVDESVARGKFTYIPETGELVIGSVDATDPAVFGADGLKVAYNKTGFRQGEINPIVYFPCTDLADPNTPAAEKPAITDGLTTPFTNYQYDMEDQEIQYEFASNTYITVNSLAKDTYTAEMYTDLRRMVEFIESLSISDQKVLEDKYAGNADVGKLVSDQLSDETALMNSAMHDRFNNMLYLLDRHASSTATSHTQLGSRMMRLELLQTRLEEDYVSYEKLQSENEDTNMEFAIMQRANAMAALEASLRANANIVQLSLANYI